MSSIFYSIIVPSFNRKDEINDLINSILQLNFPGERFELIIADDGSTDGTDVLVKQFQNKKEIPLKYLSQQNQGPGAARNMGMENAMGDFYIFIDSDCTVDKNWLSEIDLELQKSKAAAFGGPDNCRQDFPPLLKAINYSMTSFITTGGIRGHKNKKLGKFYPRSFNMGLSSELYRKIGGFGSLRHGQDIEFSNRIIKSGAKVVHIEKAIVFHKRRTSITKFFKQVYNWGVARINLYKIDKAMLEPVHFFPAVGLWMTILMAVLTFVHPVFYTIFKLFLFSGLFVLLISAIHSGFIYKNIKTAFLTPLIMPIQIYGYGTGFTIALIRRIILRQEEFTGFTKKYYG